MVKLYSNKVCDLQLASEEEDIAGGLSFLKGKEKELLQFLIKSYRGEFTPIEVSRELSVTNKTIINRLAVLVKNGFVVPILVNKRIRSYELSEFTRDHEKEIMKDILKGASKNYEVIYDRYDAIRKGVRMLKDNMILMILGKGHEDYQIIKGEKLYFSDKDVAYKVIKELEETN